MALIDATVDHRLWTLTTSLPPRATCGPGVPQKTVKPCPLASAVTKGASPPLASVLPVTTALFKGPPYCTQLRDAFSCA